LETFEQNAFRWPPISDGVMRLSASQLAALIDGLDFRASTRRTPHGRKRRLKAREAVTN
jgi:transposase